MGISAFCPGSTHLRGNGSVSLGVSATTCLDCLELHACGETVSTPWKLVLTAGGEALAAWASACSVWELVTARGEVLAAWASAWPAWELVLTVGEETLAAWASVHSAWGGIVLSP